MKTKVCVVKASNSDRSPSPFHVSGSVHCAARVQRSNCGKNTPTIPTSPPAPTVVEIAILTGDQDHAETDVPMTMKICDGDGNCCNTAKPLRSQFGDGRTRERGSINIYADEESLGDCYSVRFTFISRFISFLNLPIHSKSAKVCGVCFSVTKNLQKKTVNLDIKILRQKCVNQ